MSQTNKNQLDSNSPTGNATSKKPFSIIKQPQTIRFTPHSILKTLEMVHFTAI